MKVMTPLRGGCRKGGISLLAACTLIVSACGGGSNPADTSSSAPPTTLIPAATSSLPATTVPMTTSTTTTVATENPSQSPEDALRDGVVAALAALPMSVRVGIVAEAAAAEGVWAISRMPAAADAHGDGCRIGAPDGKYPSDFICSTEYGEVLLLDETKSRILRAYPLPGVPAEHLVVTTAAVYCGRDGVLPLPDPMLCRIDRTTLAETVRVYQPGLDSVVVQPCFFPPPSWSVIKEPLEVTALIAADTGLYAEAGDGSWTLLDGTTLQILETNAAPPPGAGS
jgi:hypothetical protein